MSKSEDMVVVIGIGVIFGFYTIYQKLNQLKDKMITQQAAPPQHNFIPKSPSPFIDWMEDLIQVHAATCNDRELSSKSITLSLSFSPLLV
jgi:hypothetical protein